MSNQERPAAVRFLAVLATALLLAILSPVVPASAAAPVSVTSYGAVPNDGADDTAAFQRAIDAAAGGVLHIPAGAYLLGTLRVEDPMEIYGDGTDSVLKLRDGANDTLLVVRHTSHVFIHDIQIDGNLAHQTGGYPHGIQFDGSPDSSVTAVYIHDCEKSGVSVYDGSDRVSVTNSTFADNENDVEIHSSAYCRCAGNHAVRTECESWCSYEQSDGPGKTHHNVIEDNYSADAYAGVNCQRSHDNVIRDNVIVNDKWGIMVEAQNGSPYEYNNTVSGNVLTGGPKSTSYAINVEAPGHDETIVGNTVSGWHATPLRVNAPHTTVSGNTFTGNDHAVQLSGAGLVVRNNTFAGADEDGVVIGDAASGMVFSGNLVQGNALEGVRVQAPLSNCSFLRNTIRGNSRSAAHTYDGFHAEAAWTGCAFIGNRVGDDGSATQLRGVWLPDGGPIAYTGNDLSGNATSARLPQAASGVSVTVPAGYTDSGAWKCMAAGRPGTWTRPATSVRVTRPKLPALKTAHVVRLAHPVTSWKKN